jgi:hypothetical protein
LPVGLAAGERAPHLREPALELGVVDVWLPAANGGSGLEPIELELEGAASALRTVRVLEGVKQLDREDEDLMRVRERRDSVKNLTELKKRGVVGVHGMRSSFRD